MSNRKHRNYGLDLVKILACILVLCLHSLIPTSPVVKNSLLNLSVYYAGTIAIPIFFMASSYFVLNKRMISYSYVIRRVGEILFIIIGWVLIYSIVHFCIKHNFIFDRKVCWYGDLDFGGMMKPYMTAVRLYSKNVIRYALK